MDEKIKRAARKLGRALERWNDPDLDSRDRCRANIRLFQSARALLKKLDSSPKSGGE